ncbi:MAG: class I SAM-dependent methyltransferase [Pseudomonadota bacterium]
MTELGAAPSEADVLATIPAADLIRAWRQDFGIDVAHLFEGIAQIEMRRDQTTGRIDFLPRVLGDAPFYQALRRFEWYHPSRKLEHVHAASLAKPGQRVLDIGAGNGDFATYLTGVDYVGLEQDEAAVGAARARGLNLQTGSIAAWRGSATARLADLVTAFQVLEHVPDPKAFLGDLKSCLAPEGRLIIGVPDADSYVSRVPDLMLNAPPHHVTWWTEASLRASLQRAGLEVLNVKRFPVEPWEYQLWWMAKFSNWMGRSQRAHFGAGLRVRKVVSYALSWPLQGVAPPTAAQGSTVLVEARHAGA